MVRMNMPFSRALATCNLDTTVRYFSIPDIFHVLLFYSAAFSPSSLTHSDALVVATRRMLCET